MPSKYTKESITPLPPTLIFSIFFKAQWKQLLLISQRFTLWQYRRGVIMVDHVRGRRRLASSRRRFGAAGHSILGRFDLEPGVPKRLGKVIIHRASDGHRVCYWLGLFVILAEAPAKMFFYHRVTSSWSWIDKAKVWTTRSMQGFHILNTKKRLFVIKTIKSLGTQRGTSIWWKNNGQVHWKIGQVFHINQHTDRYSRKKLQF